METEIALIKAMVDVLIYEQTVAPKPNEHLVALAHEIICNKTMDISKVLKNPGKLSKDSHDDLID